MKKIIYFACGIMAVWAISSCAKELVPISNQDGDLVLVNLNLSEEVTVDEMPLTKALTSNDLIGVQVYQGSNYYAYGLFDDVSKMNIYLHSGETYKFVCTVVKNGKNIVYFGQGDGSYGTGLPSYITTETGYYVLENGQYGLPFIVFDGYYMFNDKLMCNYLGMALNNAFEYNNQKYFAGLQYGSITVNNRSTNQKYPKADRFYGMVSNYQATTNGSLVIPLKRVGFGLTLSVSGVSDGNVDIIIKNSEQTFANNTGITQDKQFGTTMWSFFDLSSAWQYADNYAENFSVGVVWHRGVGVTQDLGTKTVQFKRNAVNHVKVNLSTSTKSSDLAVTLEEPVISNESFTFGN